MHPVWVANVLSILCIRTCFGVQYESVPVTVAKKIIASPYPAQDFPTYQLSHESDIDAPQSYIRANTRSPALA